MSKAYKLYSNTEILQRIGKALKDRRKFKGITQEELSFQTGYDRGTIVRLESTGKVSLVVLIEVSRYLDILDGVVDAIIDEELPLEGIKEMNKLFGKKK
ncbi:helix-turn-helix transcriptional regulator [Marivirga salinae]|uniref:Helix-turn-helix transcriptional regulator n=1 Tax=Marivirga salinarum TaxID=3059078 RepID=A0AA49GB11_9BACT|nr:helix-turn-helix transcriptional regulator [Marivirga sp. BDSF4-3]WKK77080.1 helix-turn-helix transcriptional regulator [Marivirga sp. BDSF4-3]